MKCKIFAVLIIFVATFTGCSKEPPPDSFLSANLRIITGLNTQKQSGVDTQRMHMKAVDLQSSFDRNIKKKYWKKEHENSWRLVVKTGKDPQTQMKTTFEFVLVRVPQFKDDVVVKQMIINGSGLSSNKIMEYIRMLDEARTGVRSTPSQ